MKNDKQQNDNKAGENEGESEKYPGYPQYPSDEDIYREEEEEPVDDQSTEVKNELDVPGQELDDQDEKIGEEDEENNYYSLGGDKHD